MYMNDNLLPQSILAARRVRIRLRTWAMLGLAAGSLVVGLELTARVMVPGPEAAQLQALSTLVEQETALREALREHASDLEEVTRRSRITERITTRPDWGILLAAISEKRADHVVLTAFQIEDGESSSSVRMVLSGMGLTQTGIQQFVLELENTGLFDEVTLLETRRTLSQHGERLAFNINAEITAANLSSDSGSRTDDAVLVNGGQP
jgi:Tfp pilus assembly protein PilN